MKNIALLLVAVSLILVVLVSTPSRIRVADDPDAQRKESTFCPGCPFYIEHDRTGHANASIAAIVD